MITRQITTKASNGLSEHCAFGDPKRGWEGTNDVKSLWMKGGCFSCLLHLLLLCLMHRLVPDNKKALQLNANCLLSVSLWLILHKFECVRQGETCTVRSKLSKFDHV